MHDSRFDTLAKLLVEYSTRLKRNETVLVEAFDVPDECRSRSFDDTKKPAQFLLCKFTALESAGRSRLVRRIDN